MHVIDEQFHMMRLALESHAAPSLVIATTSALSGDGAEYVAAGLGLAFADADYPTLVLEPESAKKKGASAPGPVLSPIASVQGSPNLFVASLAPRGAGSGAKRQKLQAIVDGLRADFPVIVISAGDLPASSQSLESIRIADHIVIAVRLGRASGRADQSLMSLLADRDGEVLGVVPTRPGASIDLVRGESTVTHYARENAPHRAAPAIGLVR